MWKHFQILQLKENCRQSEDTDTLNRVCVGSHNDDLKLLSQRVCGSGHPVGPDCTISQTATVLYSKHEQKDVINDQLLATLSTKLIEYHAVDTDNCGAPLNKINTKLIASTKLKVLPPAYLKLRWERGL